MRLTDEEIKGRLIRLQNVERLYAEQKVQNGKLRERVKILEAENVVLRRTVETLLIRIDELERMVFGRKRGGRGENDSQDEKRTEVRKKERDAESYKRRIPDDISREEHYPVSTCLDCGEKLQKKETMEQYVEDIVLPDDGEKSKEILRECIEKGWCMRCRRWRYGKRIRPQKVMLGIRVKEVILFGIYVLGLSFSQVQAMLMGMFDFHVSDGEILNILKTSKNKLLPLYEDMHVRIRGQPGVHFDETGWQEGLGKCYAWVMAGTESEEAVFRVGESRGKRIAEEMRGGSVATGITDGYGAYKNLFASHQECWAHLQRTARDLKNSPSLSEENRIPCVLAYHEIASIYGAIREFRESPFDLNKGKILKAKLMKRVRKLMYPHPEDPQKLRALRERFRTYEHALFTCLEKPGIPPDNNKAERKLRHLVLKRKKSFGTKTPQGSKIFSVNMSSLMSLWWTSPSSWFSKVHHLLAPTL